MCELSWVKKCTLTKNHHMMAKLKWAITWGVEGVAIHPQLCGEILGKFKWCLTIFIAWLRAIYNISHFKLEYAHLISKPTYVIPISIFPPEDNCPHITLEGKGPFPHHCMTQFAGKPPPPFERYKDCKAYFLIQMISSCLPPAWRAPRLIYNNGSNQMWKNFVLRE